MLRNAHAKVSVDDGDVADVRGERRQTFLANVQALLLRAEKLTVEGAGGWKIIEGAKATEGGRYPDAMVREG